MRASLLTTAFVDFITWQLFERLRSKDHPACRVKESVPIEIQLVCYVWTPRKRHSSAAWWLSQQMLLEAPVSFG